MPPSFEQFLQEYATRFKHTTPTGTPATPYYYGPGGLFGVSGLERELISTRIHPRGLASRLASRPSQTMSPLFPYITGFLDHSGSNPNGVCDDCPTAGPGKSCIQTAQYGRYCYMTREMELNRVGQRIDRGDFQDLQLINPPLLQDGGITNPSVNGNPDFVRETLMRFLEVGISFQNTLMRQIYTGNPANNSAGGGYKEFPGLDILISTNKVDALTGNECPSLDSDIKDFNYVKVDHNNGVDLVEILSVMMRYLSWNAERMNLVPVQWAIVMRPNLWWELTKVWPCAYPQYRCNGSVANGIVVNIDSQQGLAMRDDMRAGNYLLLDGVRYPVIVDDAIAEENAADNANIDITCFASDIYVIPMMFGGGYAGTFWEYIPYNDGPMQAAADGNLQDYFWTDGGMYLWHKKPPVNWCVQWQAKIEPRIILRVPQLAGRLQNIQYCPIQHTRDPFNDQDYFVDGGVSTSRATSTLYNDWNLPR